MTFKTTFQKLLQQKQEAKAETLKKIKWLEDETLPKVSENSMPFGPAQIWVDESKMVPSSDWWHATNKVEWLNDTTMPSYKIPKSTAAEMYALYEEQKKKAALAHKKAMEETLFYGSGYSKAAWSVSANLVNYTQVYPTNPYQAFTPPEMTYEEAIARNNGTWQQPSLTT